MIEEKYSRIYRLTKTKLVIGNGADLYCQMKTSYKDYFLSKTEINSILKNIIQLENISGRSDKNTIIDFLNEKLEQLVNNDVSVWYLYFYFDSYINGKIENEEIKWCDIESSMKKSFSKNRLDESFWDDVFMELKSLNSIDNIDNKYIIATYIMKKGKYSIYSSESEFYDYLLLELNKFEAIFGSYLNNIYYDNDKRSTYNYYKNELFSKLLTKNMISIDTFNYTNPFLINSFNDYKATCWHINGSLENGDEIIFGIDVDGINPNDSEYIFTKTCRRMLRNINLKIIKDFQCESVIIFGHSLNKQDYSYFFSLFDNLDLINPLSKSVVVFAYNIYDTNKKDNILKDFRLNVTNLMNSYCKYLGKDNLTLIDTLSFQGRMILYEI